jgi:hypothetical protein
MKKSYLLMASLVLSMVVMAQEEPVVHFGVRVGVSNAGLRGDAVSSLQNLLNFSNGAISTSSRTGFFGGAYVNLPLSEKFSIEPAVYYSQKGYALRGDLNIKGADFLGINAKSQLNASYIDLPVLAKVNLNGFQVFAGPQVSYLTGANLHTTAGALGFNILNTKTDVSGQFTNGMNLTASYDYGLIKMDDGGSFNAYNRAFKVGIGYSF